jgi:hypothetical protein
MSECCEKALLFAGLPHSCRQEWEITADLHVPEEKLGVRFREGRVCKRLVGAEGKA